MLKFIYCNLHPQGKIVGDCVKRAIAFTEKEPYEKISLELNRYKKISKAPTFNNKKNWEPWLYEKGYKKIACPVIKGQPRINVKSFCETHPEGTYILQLAKHLTACKNGDIVDTWVDWDKCVYVAWRKINNDRQ